MSASEVAPNPFWYAKSIAALTSRDRLSICVLGMFAHKSVNQLSMTRIGKPVKPPACCHLTNQPPLSLTDIPLRHDASDTDQCKAGRRAVLQLFHPARIAAESLR